MNSKHGSSEEGKGTQPRLNLVLIGFIGVMLYFLITEHRAHLSGVLNYLPYLLLLLCPLMHLFMHRGHRDGSHERERDDAENRESERGARQ